MAASDGCLRCTPVADADESTALQVVVSFALQ